MDTKERGMESSLIPRLLAQDGSSLGGAGGGRWLEAGLGVERANSFQRERVPLYQRPPSSEIESVGM